MIKIALHLLKLFDFITRFFKQIYNESKSDFLK